MKNNKAKIKKLNRFYLLITFIFISLTQSIGWTDTNLEKLENLAIKCKLFSGPVGRLILFSNYKAQTNTDPVLDSFSITSAKRNHNKCDLEIESKVNISLNVPLAYDHTTDFDPNASEEYKVRDPEKQIAAKYLLLYESNGYCEVIKFINPNEEKVDPINSIVFEVEENKNKIKQTFYYKTTDYNYITVLRNFYGKEAPECDVK